MDERIERMERTGYPYPIPKQEYPRCPVCGEAMEKIYLTASNFIAVGCDNCIISRWVDDE